MEVNGKVKLIRKDKKGVQLEDESWYSNPNLKNSLEVNKGDEVKISYTQNGQFNNLQKLEITKKTENPEKNTQTAIDQNAKLRRELDAKSKALELAVSQEKNIQKQLELAKLYLAFFEKGLPATTEEVVKVIIDKEVK